VASNGFRPSPAPRQSRRGLLATTAIATGALAGLASFIALPRPALADACDASLNSWTCEGPYASSLTFSPDDTFTIDFGPGETQFEGIFSDTFGVLVEAAGNDTSGDGVHLFADSFIDNESGYGMWITEPGNSVRVTVDGISEGDTDEASIMGTVGIYVDESESESESPGSILVYNYGHIEGTEGAAVVISGIDGVTIHNHSYASMVGAGDGATFNGDNSVYYNNQMGLTAGLGGSGLVLQDISGAGHAIDVNAAQVDNTEGGVLVGYGNGISAFGIGSTSEGAAQDFEVDNSGSFDTIGQSWTAGGLIAGMNGRGITAGEIAGNFRLDNSFTRESSIDLFQLDERVFNGEGGEDGGLLDNSDYLPSTFTTGIFGRWDGVKVDGVGGDAWVINRDGQILGAGGDGVDLRNIAGTIFVDNRYGNYESGAGLLNTMQGGRIWGGDNGVQISESGDVQLVNDLGWIFGQNNGIAVETGGRVGVSNIAGDIVGFGGNGIDIAAGGESGDKVGIYNTGSDALDWTYDGSRTGFIIGGGSALNISAYGVQIANGAYGAIVGEGGDTTPVLRLNSSSELSTSDIAESFDLPVAGIVFNDGLMTSENNPNFTDPGDVSVLNEFGDHGVNWTALQTDLPGFVGFAVSGGVTGSVANLNTYAQTASDRLIESESGATWVFNGLGAADALGDQIVGSESGGASTPPGMGMMFGRVVLTGQANITSESEGEGDLSVGTAGNVIYNFGHWYTTNGLASESAGAEGGNILASEGEDAIVNRGFIQTAFGVGSEYTSFVVDGFYNGADGGPLSLSESGLATGLLGMVDNEANDETYIYGDYYGASETGYASYLAVDTYFAAEGEGSSDKLEVGFEGEGGHDLYGSTGIIVNKLNTTPDAGIVGDRINVVWADGLDMNPDENTCFDGEWCKEGDTFFISSLSPNYVNVDGAGFIRDGMFVWGLQEFPTEGGEAPDPQFDFVAQFGPDAHDQPGLITGAQNVWYASGGVVDDHEYGNVYPQGGAGGAGADLPYVDPGEPVPPAYHTAQHRSAIWGRASGDWTNQKSSAMSGGLTYDTSFDQQTGSLLAGVELRPEYGDAGWRFGLFGGWVNSSLSFDSYGGSAKYNGGTVGGYAAFVQGPLHADVEVKADFLGVDYTSPSVTASTTATSIGVRANAGYRIDRGVMFFEPLASFSFVNTSLDNTSGGGASISYSDGQSIRAGVGARVGTTLASPTGHQVALDLTGRVWNEFGGANTVTVSDGFNTDTFTDSISGLSGEVVGRATVYSPDRMTSGFASIGGTFNSKSTTVTGKVGLRKNF